jgi:hypothetical protein
MPTTFQHLIKHGRVFFVVATLALDSRPKQGFAKVWAKREPQSPISCSRKCKRVWGNEPPHSQMNSTLRVGVQMDSQIFRGRFDSRPLKVKNRPDFLACKWCATYHWKVLDKGYNFALDFASIRGLHIKLWAPKAGTKVTRVPTLGISRFSLRSPETKWHLNVSPMVRHKVYYKGEGGGFSQVQAVVSLVSPCCPWFVRAPKVF